MASGLDRLGDEHSVNTLLYVMGKEAENIFTSFHLTDADKKKWKKVVDKFDKHFVIKRNVIYERVKFYHRYQQPGETMEEFISAVQLLAET